MTYKQRKKKILDAVHKTAKRNRLSKRDTRLLKLLVFSWTDVGPFRKEQ